VQQLAMAENGKSQLTKEEKAEFEFTVLLRTNLDAYFTSCIDIKSIAAPADGPMLTWTSPVVQVQVHVCCKKLFSKLKLPLHLSLQCLFFKFTREMTLKKYDGKWASKSKPAAAGDSDDLEDLTSTITKTGDDRKPSKRKPEDNKSTKKSKSAKTSNGAKTSKSKSAKTPKAAAVTTSKTKEKKKKAAAQVEQAIHSNTLIIL
jgi:cobalamin biosynthesis Mg chelatase CobN